MPCPSAAMFLCNNTCIQQNITISFQFWYILISSVLVNTYVQGERDVQIVILLTLEKEYLNAHNSQDQLCEKNELQDKNGCILIVQLSHKVQLIDFGPPRDILHGKTIKKRLSYSMIRKT